MVWIFRIVFILQFFLTTGCYFKSTIKPLNPESSSKAPPKTTTPLTENHEFVPGAQTTASTVRSYNKSSSIGHYQGQVLKVSSVRGYKLYSTVQGQFISKEVGP